MNKCKRIIHVIKVFCIPAVEGKEEETVFFQKMAADYYRYQIEFVNHDDSKKRAQLVEEADQFYSKALKNELKATNPTKLGLSLNYSVFKYEIANQI